VAGVEIEEHLKRLTLTRFLARQEFLHRAQDWSRQMGVIEKGEFLSKALSEQINSFDLKRKGNRRKALYFKLTVTGLGGITTILLGLQVSGYEPVLRNLALVCSAGVTLLNTWDTFFNHRGLWTRYTATYTELRAIKSDLEYLRQGGDTSFAESKVDQLYDRFQGALNETNAWWQHERQEEGTVVKANKANSAAAEEHRP
jgi:hypothetical protein